MVDANAVIQAVRADSGLRSGEGTTVESDRFNC